MSDQRPLNRFEYLGPQNADYVDELFEQYLQDPHSVDSTWRYFFEGMELGQDLAPASYTNGNGNGAAHPTPVDVKKSPIQTSQLEVSDEARVGQLITLYRSRGWLLANLDPLNPPPATHPLLELENFGLTEDQLDRTFSAGKIIGMEGQATLREIIARLRHIYCSSIGSQYAHVQSVEEREWLQAKIEPAGNAEPLTKEQRIKILTRLTDSEIFEKFIHQRYVAQKRFSIEGGESVIPSLDRMIEVGAELGAEQFVMGMAHRGRLNVLRNIYGKKAEYILTEFEQNYQADNSAGEGDVKYHMGFSADIETAKGKMVHLSLAHNPSHLEFVGAVVEGVTRGKQRYLGDTERRKVIPIVIHGDAAFAGQGVVYETLNLSQLEGYCTGGTIHLVINNQVGFTTDPKDSRSTTHATDLAMMLEIPIFHVNGDDPEAVYFVSKLATEYRQKFKKDVVINLICYRRYGHNEGDEPAFTQPLMYAKIRNHPSPREVYAKKLMDLGILTEAEFQKMAQTVMDEMAAAQEKTRAEKPKPFVSAYQSIWKKFRRATADDIFTTISTAIKKDELIQLSEKIHTVPDDFHLNSKLSRLFKQRHDAVLAGKGLDWATGELLAYASLLRDGHPIRLSGQDSERGTFGHRHSVVHDMENGKKFVPLNHLGIADQGEFIVHNSSLSETAVLGFEYGWSLADPNALVIWEAQFGDFSNGAQVIIDQFIASGESKWQRASGIVLYLPHGYEGQGPEHSSARLERFLQLGGRHNMTVGNLTTPAQLFHCLRRQLLRDFRKPLVLMTPKSLLRHPKAVSDLSELSDGKFSEVIDDVLFQGDKAKSAERVILCSGKVYYDLLEGRTQASMDDKVALIRLEQLYPWPRRYLTEILKRYEKVKEFCWAQEEPRNMGSWNYVIYKWWGVDRNFSEEVGGRPVRYIGRDRAAAPAVGSHKLHVKEQEEILTQAFTLGK